VFTGAGGREDAQHSAKDPDRFNNLQFIKLPLDEAKKTDRNRFFVIVVVNIENIGKS